MSAIRSVLSFVRVFLQSVVLALAQIWANKMRSVLTTTGIIIGVASVTAVIAGLTGLRTKVLSDFETIGTNRISIWPRRPDTGPMRHEPWWKIRFKPEQFDGLMENCPSVAAFTKVTGIEGAVRHNERVIETPDVIAIEPDWHKVENRAVIQGRPFSLVDDKEGRQICLVTQDVMDKLLLDRECVGQSILIANKSYTIVGVVEPAKEFKMFTGANEKRLEVFIPFGTAYKAERSWIDAMASAKSPEVAEEAKAEITFFLRRARNIQPGDPNTFGVETVASFIEVFNSVALGIAAVAIGIVAISLIVGGIGIMNIMLVSVSERTREIGLRKAVGARPSAIMLQFLVEAVMLCLVGGIVGVGFGQVLTLGIKCIKGAQLDKAFIPLWAIALSFGFSTLVGLFFGMFPAIKAARLDPIDALRHE